MTKVILPRPKTLVGGVLNEIATNLNLCANVAKTASNGDVVYSVDNQEYFEDVLTHSNVMLIATEGGNIIEYIMYAKMPFAIDVNGTMTSIYEALVPEGLKGRTSRGTDGTQILEDQVKNLKEWCNNNLTQMFSPDFQFTYVLTNPIGDFLTAKELQIFVNGYSATLLTRKEYQALTDLI